MAIVFPTACEIGRIDLITGAGRTVKKSAGLVTCPPSVCTCTRRPPGTAAELITSVALTDVPPPPTVPSITVTLASGVRSFCKIVTAGLAARLLPVIVTAWENGLPPVGRHDIGNHRLRWENSEGGRFHRIGSDGAVIRLYPHPPVAHRSVRCDHHIHGEHRVAARGVIDVAVMRGSGLLFTVRMVTCGLLPRLVPLMVMTTVLPWFSGLLNVKLVTVGPPMGPHRRGGVVLTAVRLHPEGLRYRRSLWQG